MLVKTRISKCLNCGAKMKTKVGQGASIRLKKGGKWIQKAVNPKHAGYCTPMTKATCTPRRKALAMIFKKHHGFHKKKAGGGLLESVINGLDLSGLKLQRPALGGLQLGGQVASDTTYQSAVKNNPWLAITGISHSKLNGKKGDFRSLLKMLFPDASASTFSDWYNHITGIASQNMEQRKDLQPPPGFMNSPTIKFAGGGKIGTPAQRRAMKRSAAQYKKKRSAAPTKRFGKPVLKNKSGDASVKFGYATVSPTILPDYKPYIPKNKNLKRGNTVRIARKKPGGSNVGRDRKTSRAGQGPFVGPAGGAPAGSYPVTNPGQWHAALAYARHAPNPAGIKAAANRIARARGWKKSKKESGGMLRAADFLMMDTPANIQSAFNL